MLFLRNIGIKGKLIIIQIFSVTITASIVGFALYLFLIQKIKDQKIRETEGVSKVIALNALPAMQFLDESVASDVLSTIEAFPNIDVAYIEDTTNTIFSKYEKKPIEAEKPTFSNVQNSQHIYLENALYSKYKIVEGDLLFGNLYIVSNTNDVNELTRSLIITILISIGSLILISFILILTIHGLVTKPIKRLLEGVQAISSEQNYSHRVEKFGSDEIGVLTDKFNGMMITLEKNKNRLDSENERLDIVVKERTSELEVVNKQMELHLKELEVANSELSQFVYIVSHDLKAPIRAISTLSTFLEEDLGSNIDEDAKQHLHLIKERTQRMKNLIEGLLEYSKTGKVKKEIVKFSTDELFSEIKSTFNDYNDYKISCIGNNQELVGDKISMFQVVQNLVQNAIKYNDKAEKLVNVTFSDEENFYIFAVEDNGPGIDPQYHTRIFEVFKTLQGRDEIESTGLGLSIVKKIMDENGGDITVESDGKLGTTFKVKWKKINNGK